MHRNRTWQIDPKELRTQRNRILPIEGGDGSTLSLDFTTGVLDQRLTFTRTTNATFINSQGYVQYANANIIRQSENCGSWSGGQNITPTADAAVAPNGTQTADQLDLAATNYRYQVTAIVYAVGQSYVASIWMRTVSGTASVGFRIANTTTGSNSAIATCSVTETWQRFNTPAFTLTDTANRTIDVGIDQRSIVSGPNVAANIYVWGLQVQPGTSVGEYLPTTTTENFNTPRFDYDPTTLAPRGLLIEGSTSNYVLRSGLNPFASPTWQTAGTTLPTIEVAYTGNGFAPDNTSRPTRVQFAVNGGSASRIIQQTSYATNPTTAAPYTVSVWMKSNTAGTNYTIHILGTAGSIPFTVTPTWQRFTLVNTSGTSLVGYVYISNESGSVAADVLIWGAQLEAGSGASSYIPTGASTGSRAADYCTMPTSSFITGNPYPNTLFVDCIPMTANSGFPNLASLFDRTGATFSYGNQIYYYNAATMSVNRKVTASTNSDRTMATGLAYNTRHKFATSISSASFIGSRDGVTDAGATTAPSALSSAVTHFGIGCNGDSTASAVMNGWLRQIKFWPTNLPQATINSITTL
jgi:hypothetical protein